MTDKFPGIEDHWSTQRPSSISAKQNVTGGLKRAKMTQNWVRMAMSNSKRFEKMPASIVIDGAKFNRGGADQPQ